jgi:hypothetical protein
MAVVIRPRRFQAQPVVPDVETFLGDETLDAPTTAGGTPLAAVPAGTRHAYFYVRTNAAIFRPTDGSAGGAPDSTHGVTVGAGSGYDYSGDPTLLKFLGVGGTASVYAMYFGEA